MLTEWHLGCYGIGEKNPKMKINNLPEFLQANASITLLETSITFLVIFSVDTLEPRTPGYLSFKIVPLLKKCPYSELLWCVFSRIQTDGKTRTRITPNTDTFYGL